MQLSIVISRAGVGEARMASDSDLGDIVQVLNLLGVQGWNLYNKGAAARLEVNRSDLYVAVGPPNNSALKEFLKEARSFIPDTGGLETDPH